MSDKDRRFLPKAYDNTPFLHSPQARTIRLLAEYLEPQARLRRYKVRGTIVFFGSARALPPEKLGEKIQQERELIALADATVAAQINRRIVAYERMSRYYADAVELARRLTEYYQKMPDQRDRHVVCSGGGPGMMEAANRGAHEAGGKTVGFGISLPFEQTINDYIDSKLAFEFHYFFMRKYWFIYTAQALVAFPGGFGTMDEFFEVMTLTQTKKVSRRLPIVLYGSDYWNTVINWEAMIQWGTIAADDLNLFKVCDTPVEAFDYLKSAIKSRAEQEQDEG